MATLSVSSNTTSDGLPVVSGERGGKLVNYIVYIDSSGNVLDSMPVTVNGRKVEVSASDYGQTLNVAAGGNANITVSPPVGQLWRIKSIYLYLPAPTGATSGSHQFLVGHSIAGSGYDLLFLSTAYNKTLMIRRNTIPTVDLADPFDAISQIKAITSLVATNTCPLSLYYTNQTNATQTGNLTLRIAREVEYIA
jgi:hypothetical protein